MTANIVKGIRAGHRRRAVHLCMLGCGLLLLLSVQDACAALEYIYDAAGRLALITDDSGNVLVYSYDRNGNVVSITRTTSTGLGPPAITAVTPETLNQGEQIALTLTGTNLFLGDLSLDNPGMVIVEARTTRTGIRATLQVAPDAPLGASTLTVTTVLGATSVALTVAGPLPRLIGFIPQQGVSIGGTLVTFSGVNFTADTTLTIGGNAVGDLVLVNAGMISARTPPGVPGRSDITVRNANGRSTVANGFLYTFPFTIPGAVGVETGGSGSLTVMLPEPAAADTVVTVINADPSVATLPDTMTIPAGATSVGLPITALVDGLTTVTLTVAGQRLSTVVFVTAPVSGTLDIVAGTVGSAISGPPTAVVVGTAIAAAPLAHVEFSRGTTQTVTVPLATPAPAGGLCVTVAITNAALATAPEEVCIAAGQQTVAIAVTALASGTGLMTVTAGTEVITIALRVDRPLGIQGDGLAAPTGTFVTPTTGATHAPVVGLFVTPTDGLTLAPVVGVRVDDMP